MTIDEGSEKAVWNCFRAKCGWTGSVNTQAGINKAYRQFTNADGAGCCGKESGGRGVREEAGAGAAARHHPGSSSRLMYAVSWSPGPSTLPLCPPCRLCGDVDAQAKGGVAAAP